VLEFIPLDELANGESISVGAEMVWEPAVRWSLDHHLFTEEEVYRYCVEANYTFPQHFSSDSVVFVANPLEESPILQQLDKLETLWVNILSESLIAPYANKSRTTAQLPLTQNLGNGIFLRRGQVFSFVS
jgi:hypothetical protein